VWTTLVLVAAAVAGGPRSVCELQVRSDGEVAARGACPDEVVGAAGALAATARPALGPHPTEVRVDGVRVQRLRVVLGRAAPRVTLRPVTRVRARVVPVVSDAAGLPESCGVQVQVDDAGEVVQAVARRCAGAQAAVEDAAAAWRFRPLILDGVARGFETEVVVPLARQAAHDSDPAAGIEAAGDVLTPL